MEFLRTALWKTTRQKILRRKISPCQSIEVYLISPQSLSMSSSVCYAFLFITRYEAMGVGAGWSEIWEAPNNTSDMNIAIAVGMVLFDSFLYVMIGLLLDRFFGKLFFLLLLSKFTSQVTVHFLSNQLFWYFTWISFLVSTSLICPTVGTGLLSTDRAGQLQVSFAGFLKVFLETPSLWWETEVWTNKQSLFTTKTESLI